MSLQKKIACSSFSISFYLSQLKIQHTFPVNWFIREPKPSQRNQAMNPSFTSKEQCLSWIREHQPVSSLDILEHNRSKTLPIYIEELQNDEKLSSKQFNQITMYWVKKDAEEKQETPKVSNLNRFKQTNWFRISTIHVAIFSFMLLQPTRNS